MAREGDAFKELGRFHVESDGIEKMEGRNAFEEVWVLGCVVTFLVREQVLVRKLQPMSFW
jgi:hypothetical protein